MRGLVAAVVLMSSIMSSVLAAEVHAGIHLLVEVDVDIAIRERLSAVVETVRTELRKKNIGYTRLAVEHETAQFKLHDTSVADQVRELLWKVIPDMLLEISDDGAATIAFKDDSATEARRRIVGESMETIRRRIDGSDVRAAVIQQWDYDRVLVYVDGVQDPARLKALVGKTAKMTFRFADISVPPDPANVPPTTELLAGLKSDAATGVTPIYVVQRRVMVSGENLTDAQPSFQNGLPVVSLRFDAVGAKRLVEATSQNVGKVLAIVLDDKVISAHVVQEPILGGNAIIDGNLTVQEAQDLALLLRAGALPAPLAILEERTVSPLEHNRALDLGGIVLEVRARLPISRSDIQTRLSDLGIGDISVQQFGNEYEFLIRVQRQDEGAQTKAVAAIKAALGNAVEYRRTSTIGPAVYAGEFDRRIASVTSNQTSPLPILDSQTAATAVAELPSQSFSLTHCSGFSVITNFDVTVVAPAAIDLRDNDSISTILDRAKHFGIDNCKNTSYGLWGEFNISIKIIQNGKEEVTASASVTGEGELENPSYKIKNHILQREEARREADEKDKAVAESRAIRRNFESEYRLEFWTTQDTLKTNPFPLKGKVVGVHVFFRQMISEHEAVFDDVVATEVPPTTFTQRGAEVILALKVEGLKPTKIMELEILLPYGSYVGSYSCKLQGCSDFWGPD